MDQEKFLRATAEVRGGQRVTSASPEDTYEALSKYGRDLVEDAGKGKLDPVIGRDQEIRRTIRILSRRTKNNPVLIGEAGHDIYDVPSKATSGEEQEESEEIYEYLLCAVCPVDLAKPALGYKEDENRIGARDRDWVVGLPDLGFVYPAFSDRGSAVNAVM